MSEYISPTEKLPDSKQPLNVIAHYAHYCSKRHGFWLDVNGAAMDPNDVTVRLSKLALICSEVGEAVEAVRDADNDNLIEELADIVIRVGDLAWACNLDLGGAVFDKMAINADRPYRHGRKA